MLEPDRDDQRFSYAPFTQHAFYQAVNSSLVERAVAHLSPHSPQTPYTIVDLGCGTGAVTPLIVEALQERGRRPG